MLRIPTLFVMILLIESCRSGFPAVEDHRKNLPASSDSVSVVHVSDLHFGRYRRVHHRSVRAIRKLKPDIIVITGDSVNGPDGLDELGDFLSLLPDSAAVFAIPGNWEYGELISTRELSELYRIHGVRFLVNGSHEYVKNGTRLRITGLDDYLFGNPDYSLVDPALEYQEIILVHEPAAFLQVPKAQSSNPEKTVLAGHTHGGQITVFGKAFYLPPGSAGFVSGRYIGDGKHLFVSRGISSGFFTLRIFARPDIMVYSY